MADIVRIENDDGDLINIYAEEVVYSLKKRFVSIKYTPKQKKHQPRNGGTAHEAKIKDNLQIAEQITIRGYLENESDIVSLKEGMTEGGPLPAFTWRDIVNEADLWWIEDLTFRDIPKDKGSSNQVNRGYGDAVSNKGESIIEISITLIRGIER
ncbi:MAG: hypothetical protein ACTSQY_01025 [Candidatus Odinarchaeia archaeon]